jgi:hypothetical protein
MARFLNDFLSDSNGELIVRNGKLLIGPADEQYIKEIIYSNQGEYLHHPTVGVGIRKFLGGPTTQTVILETLIRTQLKKDGYAQVDINVNGDAGDVQIPLSDTLLLNVSAYRK